MKQHIKTLLTIIILLSGAPRLAASNNGAQLLQQGNDAYCAGNYADAARCYEAILAEGETSADLYYNLGNTYYRLEEYGRAILNYERALRLKPNDRDTRENLALANSKTQDQIAVLPQFFLSRCYRHMVEWFSPRGWRIAVLVVLLILAISVAAFLLSHRYGLRKGTFVSSLAFLALFALATACAFSSAQSFRSHKEAIVTQPLIVVKSAPESGSVDKLVLHEGTKVSISETIGSWHRIHLSDGNNGWVEDHDIERI